MRCSNFLLAVVDAQQLAAWHARALIRDGSWYGLSKVIDAMPAELKREEVWTYWCGRALASRGLKTDAQTAFTSIAHRTTFYGKLAADELGRSYGFSKPPKAMPRQVEIDKWAENTAIQRARSLYRMSLYARDTVNGTGQCAASLRRRVLHWQPTLGRRGSFTA